MDDDPDNTQTEDANLAQSRVTTFKQAALDLRQSIPFIDDASVSGLGFDLRIIEEALDLRAAGKSKPNGSGNLIASTMVEKLCWRAVDALQCLESQLDDASPKPLDHASASSLEVLMETIDQMREKLQTAVERAQPNNLRQ